MRENGHRRGFLALGLGAAVLVASSVLAQDATSPTAKAEKPKNLFPWVFTTANADGLPAGYQPSDTLTGKLHFVPAEGDKPAALVIDLKTEGIAIMYSNVVKLEPDKNYLFTLETKIDNLQYQGVAQEEGTLDHTVAFYLYGSVHDVHSAVVVVGKGSTPGWVTAVIPVNTKTQAELTTSYMLVRCYKVQGAVSIRNPSIIEMPAGTSVGRSHFLLENGTVVDGHNVLK